MCLEIVPKLKPESSLPRSEKTRDYTFGDTGPLAFLSVSNSPFRDGRQMTHCQMAMGVAEW